MKDPMPQHPVQPGERHFFLVNVPGLKCPIFPGAPMTKNVAHTDTGGMGKWMQHLVLVAHEGTAYIITCGEFSMS